MRLFLGKALRPLRKKLLRSHRNSPLLRSVRKMRLFLGKALRPLRKKLLRSHRNSPLLRVSVACRQSFTANGAK